MSAELIRQKLVEERRSVKEVADFLRCTEHNIRRICREEGIPLPPRQRGPRQAEAYLPISQLHSQIGRDLLTHQVLKLEASQARIRDLTRMSYNSLTMSEVGAYDYRLSELVTIAELLGIELQELVTLRVNHE